MAGGLLQQAQVSSHVGVERMLASSRKWQRFPMQFRKIGKEVARQKLAEEVGPTDTFPKLNTSPFSNGGASKSSIDDAELGAAKLDGTFQPGAVALGEPCEERGRFSARLDELSGLEPASERERRKLEDLVLCAVEELESDKSRRDELTLGTLSDDTQHSECSETPGSSEAGHLGDVTNACKAESA